MTKRKSEYKPLLFTTTMRNPERFKNFLSVLAKYNGQVLTNDLVLIIVKDLIKSNIYTTTYISRDAGMSQKIRQGLALTDEEVDTVVKNSPQDHKEAGFDKGWPSRFDTWFKLAKELGFVYYEQNKKIEFSEIGLKLADVEHPEYEQQAFLNAFVKYQRNNPFRRILNENVPLILLLKSIMKANADKEFNGKGLTRQEIPIVLCWRDNDADALYAKIRELRKKYRYNPSNEVVLEICDKLTEGRHASNKDVTIMQEYPDEFIRKMKLTGLITIRGYGRFVDINNNEINKINYVLDKYSEYKKFSSEREYFDHMSVVDDHLFSAKLAPKVDKSKELELLVKWADYYKWEIIKGELGRLAAEQSSTDEVLKFIPGPVRLEFLTAIALVKNRPDMSVIPNYIADDEGLPSSQAPGGCADIECDENGNAVLFEVTLITGTQQQYREIPPIVRHLKERKDTNPNSVSYFVSPRVHADSIFAANFAKAKENLDILPVTIDELSEKLETTDNLYPN